MDLFLKSASEGKSVGDCPFVHCVRMALHLKVSFILKLETFKPRSAHKTSLYNVPPPFPGPGLQPAPLSKGRQRRQARLAQAGVQGEDALFRRRRKESGEFFIQCVNYYLDRIFSYFVRLRARPSASISRTPTRNPDPPLLNGLD